MVRPSRVFQVQQDTVEGPGEGQVHGGIMGSVTLQTHVLAPVDVGVGRRQRDLGGIWSKDESWQLEASEMLRWDGGATSDRQVSRAVGFSQVVLGKAGVLPFIGPADVVKPQNSVWGHSHPGNRG